MTTESSDGWTSGDAYEAYMGRWSRPVARSFITWLEPKRSAHWLDVGCGTGALTRMISERCEPASVIGCDPSESFIDHARNHFPDARVSFVRGSFEDLPTRQGGFDVIVSALVLNFVPEPDRAVASMLKRLCQGGVAAAYVWDYAEGTTFLRTFWDEAIAIEPSAAELDEGRRFPLSQPDVLAALFRRSGLGRVETQALSIQTDFADFADYWRPFLGGTGPAPAFVQSLARDRRERLRDRLERRLPVAADGSIRLRARAWAVRGIAP
jgi:trans-aconitate methyltransferase